MSYIENVKEVYKNQKSLLELQEKTQEITKKKEEQKEIQERVQIIERELELTQTKMKSIENKATCMLEQLQPNPQFPDTKPPLEADKDSTETELPEVVGADSTEPPEGMAEPTKTESSETDAELTETDAELTETDAELTETEPPKEMAKPIETEESPEKKQMNKVSKKLQQLIWQMCREMESVNKQCLHIKVKARINHRLVSEIQHEAQKSIRYLNEALTARKSSNIEKKEVSEKDEKANKQIKNVKAIFKKLQDQEEETNKLVREKMQKIQEEMQKVQKKSQKIAREAEKMKLQVYQPEEMKLLQKILEMQEKLKEKMEDETKNETEDETKCIMKEMSSELQQSECFASMEEDLLDAQCKLNLLQKEAHQETLIAPSQGLVEKVSLCCGKPDEWSEIEKRLKTMENNLKLSDVDENVLEKNLIRFELLQGLITSISINKKVEIPQPTPEVAPRVIKRISEQADELQRLLEEIVKSSEEKIELEKKIELEEKIELKEKQTKLATEDLTELHTLLKELRTKLVKFLQKLMKLRENGNMMHEVPEQRTITKANEIIKEMQNISKKAKSIEREARAAQQQQWDNYYMKIACLAALRSKDPGTPVGACIVNTESYQIVGIGYNSMPYIKDRINDKVFPWKAKHPSKESGKPKEESSDNSSKEDAADPEFKKAYVVHAAINAITSKTKESIEGCTIYLTHFPDDDCAHAILTAGIKEIVYCMFTRELNFRKDQDCKWITEANKILEQRNIEIRSLEINEHHDLVMKLWQRLQKEEKNSDTKPSENAISWEEFFMGVAKLSRKRPLADRYPANVVGACIVSSTKQVMAVGYSGLYEPQDGSEYQRHAEIHAEYKAIIAAPSVRGCTLYVTTYPCNVCAKLVVQSGITKVVYDKPGETKGEASASAGFNKYESSRNILEKCLGEENVKKYGH